MTHLITRGANMNGLRWLDVIRQDARFGVRMLVKYRGMTMVGAFAMAVAIAVGATTFAAISAMLDPALPFPGVGRVVALNFVDPSDGLPERQVIHQFAALRGRLVTVEHFGAFHDAEHNLVASETAPEPVAVAEITASGSRSPARRHRWGAICCLPTNPNPPLPSSSSVTAPGSFALGVIRTSWDARSVSGAWPGRSSASCRENSSSRTITSSGFPCARIR